MRRTRSGRGSSWRSTRTPEILKVRLLEGTKFDACVVSPSLPCVVDRVGACRLEGGIPVLLSLAQFRRSPGRN